MRIRPMVTLFATMTVLGGCAEADSIGGQGVTPSKSSYPPVSAPPEAFRLAPDGSVPWVDEPIADGDIIPHSPPPSAPAGTKPCQARQLTGTLDSWTRPNYGVETPRGFDANISHIWGYVDVHNTSTSWCTLQGEVPTTMLADKKTVPMAYRHDVNDRAQAEVTSVPPNGHASLRVDWNGPFCEKVTGQLRLAIELPHGGGTLTAPITAADRPECNPGAVKPNVKGGFSASVFSEAVDPRPIGRSQFEPLTGAATGPAAARPGERIAFRITLTNPTDKSIAFEPCPAYLLRLSARSDGSGGVFVKASYLLNCRPVHAIAPGESLTFQIGATVPKTVAPGRELQLEWTLCPREQTLGGQSHIWFTIPII